MRDILPLSSNKESILDRVLARSGLRQHGASTPVHNSVQNENVRVHTNQGDYFVRFHGTQANETKLSREQRVIQWAKAHGLPVIAPCCDTQGRSLWQEEGQWISLYPWVEGHTWVRGSIQPPEARVLGEMHGRLHATLATYEDPDLSSEGTGSSWNTEQTLLRLEQIQQELQKKSVGDAEEKFILNDIQNQRAFLFSSARPASDFGTLSRQPVHGDYHEGNVLVNGLGQVEAVVDWEMVGRLPPVFEVLRTLSYVRLLLPELLTAYLTGYQQWARLTEQECTLGVEMWWQSLLHDTWAWQRYFVEGDVRTKRFFPFVRARFQQFSEPAFRIQLSQTLWNHFKNQLQETFCVECVGEDGCQARTRKTPEPTVE